MNIDPCAPYTVVCTHTQLLYYGTDSQCLCLNEQNGFEIQSTFLAFLHWFWLNWIMLCFSLFLKRFLFFVLYVINTVLVAV